MTRKTTNKTVKYFGLLTAAQVRKHLGVSQATLTRLVKSTAILRLGFGLYAHPDCKILPQEVDFAVACARFGPKSAIGGLTALFHHKLTDAPPNQIWVISPPEKSDHNTFYRTLRTKSSPTEGVNRFEFYRMTNIERSIIEGLWFRTKIGERTAINAARTALKQGMTTEKKLGEMARKLKLRSVFEKYWEAIVV